MATGMHASCPYIIILYTRDLTRVSGSYGFVGIGMRLWVLCCRVRFCKDQRQTTLHPGSHQIVLYHRK